MRNGGAVSGMAKAGGGPRWGSWPTRQARAGAAAGHARADRQPPASPSALGGQGSGDSWEEGAHGPRRRLNRFVQQGREKPVFGRKGPTWLPEGVHVSVQDRSDIRVQLGDRDGSGARKLLAPCVASPVRGDALLKPSSCPGLRMVPVVGDGAAGSRSLPTESAPLKLAPSWGGVDFDLSGGHL